MSFAAVLLLALAKSGVASPVPQPVASPLPPVPQPVQAAHGSDEEELRSDQVMNITRPSK